MNSYNTKKGDEQNRQTFFEYQKTVKPHFQFIGMK